jgi:UDP-N-acetylmuramoylalanine--D-glutamate ligase
MSIELPDFYGKHIIFIGRGKEWHSFEKFCLAHMSPLSLKNVFIDDTNRESIAAQLRAQDPSSTIVVKTAGYPGHLMPVAYTTPTRIFFDCAKQLRSKIVAITGTKGKTTTTSLLGTVIKNAGYDARVCGNIGIPMLDSLEGATQSTIFVVEMSSYQLTELTSSPDVAVITNLFRDHIDYHGNLEAYWEAKHNIMRYMDETGSVVFNPDFEIVLHWFAESKAKQVPIDPQEDVDMSHAKLIGDHNKLNFLMVRAVADLFGIDRSITTSTFNNFEPIRHRLQPVRTVRGITFVDDAIGSTPEATVAGIEALIRNRGPVGCVMLGGLDRQYDYSKLVGLLQLLNVPKLVLFPDTGPKIKAMLPEGYAPDTFETKDMESAVNWAAENTPSGSICLLSTAAPSTVLWVSFEEKGSLFQQFVLDLPELAL